MIRRYPELEEQDREVRAELKKRMALCSGAGTKAMLAWGYYGEPVDGERGTATWEKVDEEWQCVSASRTLKWMVGMDGEKAKAGLAERGMRWEWLPRSGMPKCWKGINE